jgi:hypothetical protein
MAVARALFAPGFLATMMLSCDHSTAPASGSPARIVVASTASVGLRAHYSLAPIVLDSAGHDVSKSVHVQWTTSNAAIATVDDSGVVFGVALGGPVTITGTAGTVTAPSTLSIVPADVVITPVIPGLELNAAQQMSADPRDFLGAHIDAGPIVWSSSDPGVVAVNPVTGLARGAGIGTAIISATVAGRVSGLGIFVDVASPYDGVYAGNPDNDPVQLRVLLGRVTDFSAVIHTQGGCVATITAHPNAVIADAVFATGVSHATAFNTADGQATVQMSFQAAGTASGNFTGSVFNSGQSCTTGSNTSTQATRTFSASR